VRVSMSVLASVVATYLWLRMVLQLCKRTRRTALFECNGVGFNIE
jgi:hypothetical protein